MVSRVYARKGFPLGFAEKNKENDKTERNEGGRSVEGDGSRKHVFWRSRIKGENMSEMIQEIGRD